MRQAGAARRCGNAEDVFFYLFFFLPQPLGLQPAALALHRAWNPSPYPRSVPSRTALSNFQGGEHFCSRLAFSCVSSFLVQRAWCLPARPAMSWMWQEGWRRCCHVPRGAGSAFPQLRPGEAERGKRHQELCPWLVPGSRRRQGIARCWAAWSKARIVWFLRIPHSPAGRNAFCHRSEDRTIQPVP